MLDVKDLFDAATEQVEPDVDAWHTQDGAHRRFRRNRRVGALVVVAALAATAGVIAVRTAEDHPRPRPAQTATPAPTTPAPRATGSPVPPPPLPPADVSFVDVRTGAARPLPRKVRSIANAQSFQVSPDGRMLAFLGGYSPAQIYVANIDGTHLRRVSTITAYSAGPPRWSPDSTRVVYAGELGNGETRLFVSTVASGDATQVTGTPPGELVSPFFTHDGTGILFSLQEIGASDLWVIPVAGGKGHLVLRNAAQASFSPGGDTIAYRPLPAECRHCYALLRPQSIVLADEHGRNARGLASWRGEPIFMLLTEPTPSWSPDGSRIAVEATVGPNYRGAGGGCDRVFVIDVTTHAMTDIGCGNTPSWFDDHTLIVAGYSR